VEHFSNPSDLVVIPFVGSGAECVAAIEGGRRFIGAEINRAYLEIARSRIAEASAHLFQKAPEKAVGQGVSSKSFPILPNHGDPVVI
jgi:DNA modification methylase